MHLRYWSCGLPHTPRFRLLLGCWLESRGSLLNATQKRRSKTLTEEPYQGYLRSLDFIHGIKITNFHKEEKTIRRVRATQQDFMDFVFIALARIPKIFFLVTETPMDNYEQIEALVTDLNDPNLLVTPTAISHSEECSSCLKLFYALVSRGM